MVCIRFVLIFADLQFVISALIPALEYQRAPHIFPEYDERDT
ncbi:hypothetical protein AcetOrient_orf02911 [Acetobacter orientalis]|uniref:Uncharacterized protein n=1 Tax=Acetobacter orientalis TaxID=146474 RepID=A0A2Z5ZJL2_9PROT|nr:hypothetical protein AcetOrient_orf02911 [Acetobacter orientalis]